ncbi:MAG: hypothetical protein AAFZ02_08940 [Pseudomonadota bacterium]
MPSNPLLVVLIGLAFVMGPALIPVPNAADDDAQSNGGAPERFATATAGEEGCLNLKIAGGRQVACDRHVQERKPVRRQTSGGAVFITVSP